jgi:hypothetical protein
MPSQKKKASALAASETANVPPSDSLSLVPGQAHSWSEIHGLIQTWETLTRRRESDATLLHTIWAQAQATQNDFWKKLETLRIEAFDALTHAWREGWANRRDKALVELGCGYLAEKLEIEHGLDMSERWQRAFGSLSGWNPPSPDNSVTSESDPESSGQEKSSQKSHQQSRSKEPLASLKTPSDLRALYLMLARALHPDKELDAEKREMKTQWMQQATEAYGRRDAGALLALAASNPMGALDASLTQASRDTRRNYAKRLRREIDWLQKSQVRSWAEIPGDWRGWATPAGINEKALKRWQSRYRQELAGMRERTDGVRSEAKLRQVLDWVKDKDWGVLW